jgi:hypothetical protein
MERSFAGSPVFDATKRKNKRAMFLHFHRVETSVEKDRDKKGRDNTVAARCVSPRRQERLGNKSLFRPEIVTRKRPPKTAQHAIATSLSWELRVARDKTRFRYRTQ